MSHNVEGLIARAAVLNPLLTRFRHAHLAPLAQGVTFLPNTDGLHDEVGGGEPVAPHIFWKLSSGLARLATELSENGPVAYIETDYFGGHGSQSATVWEGGSAVLLPIKYEGNEVQTAGAINAALKRIGVDRVTVFDEFEAVGLDRYRSNEDLIKSARRPHQEL